MALNIRLPLLESESVRERERDWATDRRALRRTPYSTSGEGSHLQLIIVANRHIVRNKMLSNFLVHFH